MYHANLRYFLDGITVGSGDGERMGKRFGTVILEGKLFQQHRERWLYWLDHLTAEIAWKDLESPKLIEIGSHWFAETFPVVILETPYPQRPKFILGFFDKVWNHQLIQARRSVDPVWIARAKDRPSP